MLSLCTCVLLKVLARMTLDAASGLFASTFGQFCVALPGEYAGFHPAGAVQPPIGGNYLVHEHVLQLVCKAFVQICEVDFVFSWDKDLFGAQTVL